MDVIWIVVANGNKARFYEISSDKSRLRRFAEYICPDSRKKGRELQSDRPGRIKSSASVVRHALSTEESPNDHAENAFSKELCTLLEQHFMRQHFQEIALVAEPAFLGKLRIHFPKNLTSKVIATLPKDYTGKSDHELNIQLQDFRAAIWKEHERRKLLSKAA